MEEATIQPPTVSEPASHKQRRIILFTLGAVLSVALGVGVGYILSEVFPFVTKSVDYNGLDPTKLRADKEACYKKATRASDPFDGSCASWELINAALYKFESHEHSMTQGIGNAYAKIGPAAVEQKIRSTTYRVGDSYFEESLSQSFAVNVAWRMYLSSDTDSMTWRYQGTCPNDVEVGVFDANAAPTSYTDAEYLEHAGRNLDGDSCIYLISDKTLASSSQSALSGDPMNSVVKNADGNYAIDVELDYRKGVVNYVKQMTATTEMNGKPYFDYCHIQFVLTPDLDIVYSKTNEKYFASTPSGSSNITASIVTTYAYDGDYEIPDLNVPVSYK